MAQRSIAELPRTHICPYHFSSLCRSGLLESEVLLSEYHTACCSMEVIAGQTISREIISTPSAGRWVSFCYLTLSSSLFYHIQYTDI